MLTAALSRLFVGFGVLGAAIVTRCFAPATGGVILTFGPHVPALTRLDLITAPVALMGILVLGAGRGLASSRRVLGLVALIAAIAWPALKLGDMGQVLLVLSEQHGVHTHDLAVFPVLAAALGLLAPWRSPLRLAAPVRVIEPSRALRPATPQ